MSAGWWPRGIGRIGFLALALAGMLLVWQRTTEAPLAGVDPLVGRTLELTATTALPGRIEPRRREEPPRGPHLVNLFASWCVPCRVEAPVLATLAARGIRIDGIAVRDDPAAVAGFLKRSGDPFGSVRLDRLGRVQAALGVAGLPETYVVDTRGVIAYRHRGALAPSDTAALAALLR